MPYDDDQLVSTARKRLAQAKTSDQHNRIEAENDLLFRVLQQWDETVRDQRTNSEPSRPCITIDRLGAFCNQVVNDIRQSKPAPSVAPGDNEGSEETAEVIEGWVRRMLYESDSELAFQEAVKYAVVSGMGCFRLDPEVVDAKRNRQELRVNPIYDPSTVWWDPFSQRPDKADARWCIVIDIMSRIEYRERWPDSEVAMADFSSRDWPGDWMDPRSDGESVMVAEYWCVETVGDDVAIAAELNDPLLRREKRRPKPGEKRVRMHLINGVEELEPPVERPGQHIPIFAVEGDSFWVKGKRYVQSLIRSARDIQRLYNWEATKKVEFLAMQATAPYLVTPEQVQGFESDWQRAATTNLSYLKYNVDPEAPGPPIRTNAEAPIQAISQAMAFTAQEMRDVIGIQDPSLGRPQSANQSGIAIQQLRTEGDTATYHYSDNLTRTMKHFARVLVDWLPHYYDLEHDLRITRADMKRDRVRVNAKAQLDPKTGRIIPAHSLTHGQYDVVIDVGPSEKTAREAEAAFMSNLVQAVPEAFMVIGDLLLASRDSPGAKEAAERLKQYIALKTPGLIQDGQNALPPAAQAQMQAMSAQLQQLQQLVQQQAMHIKTQAIPKQIEAQSRLATEAIRAKSNLTAALIDAKTKLAKAAAEHKHAMYDTTLREATDAVDRLTEMFHESEMAPGPDGGPQGLDPTAVPQPLPNGAAAQ